MRYEVHLAQEASKGGLKLLNILVQDDSNIIERGWGLEGGKMQEAEKEVAGKNIGRSNETTPHEQALSDAQSITARKTREGYRDVNDETAQAESQAFTFHPLPPNWVPSKPNNALPKGVTMKGGYETYVAERKYNGVNLLKVTDEVGGVHWYTRGIKDITEVVKNIVPLQHFGSIVRPPGTIDSMEFVCFDKNGKEMPKMLRGIVNERTSTKKSDDRYAKLESEGYTFGIKLFDILFEGGVDITNTDYHSRRQVMNRAYWQANPEYRSTFFNQLNDEIIQQAYEAGWEGFVLRVLTGPNSYVAFSMNGKPKRRGAWKFKFELTDDYVVYEIEKGTSGRLKGRIARFHLGKYDDAGQLVEACWAGPGTLTTEELDNLAARLFQDATFNDIGSDPVIVVPFAVEVKFSAKQPGTNALEHPVLMEERPDKPLAECLLSDVPQLFKK